MPTVSFAPYAVPQFLDNEGKPIRGGTLETYLAGTSTPAATYADSAGKVANPTTIQLDSAGRPANGGALVDLRLDVAKSYKFVLKDKAGAVVRTVDNIAGGVGSDALVNGAVGDKAITDSPDGQAAIARKIGAVQRYSTIADMVGAPPPEVAANAIVEGYQAAGDGGGGSFYWDAGSTAPDNGVTVFAPVGHFGNGRWVRIFAEGGALTPQMAGMFAGGGDAQAGANAAALDRLKTVAAAGRYRVQFPAGVYTLPSNQQLRADDTEWSFAPGAILKLWSTQAVNQDFLVWDRPERQIVRNIQIDGSRADQDTETFGIDRCAGLLVSPQDCLFDGIHIVSSPAKGFVMVSAAGETSRRTHLRRLTGGNCDRQAFIADGNNGTGFFDACSIDGVTVGETSHAGLALNDGFCNSTVTNVECNVGASSVWDAVSVRDAWNLQLSNIKGTGGTNGVAFRKLSLRCEDIQLNNIHGEGASQNGVLFLAAKRITGSGVTGVNNGSVGVNFARITSGDQRCEDIQLTNVVGIDTRTSPTQQYGILMGGTRRCSVNGWRATGNTIANTYFVAAVNEGSRIEWSKQFTAEVPSIPATGTAYVDIPISAPFPIEHLAIRSLRIDVGTTSRALQVSHVAGFTASAIRVVVVNTSGTAAFTGTLVAVVGSR